MTKHACAAQPIARQFTTEYAHEGEGAGASERDVDDSDRAAEFKRMFTELQELPHVQMIDCSPMALYNRAHFLGAIPLDQHQRTMKSANSPLHVVTQAEIEQLMNSLKVGPDTYVFAYDSDNGLYASRFVWTLWYYGHQNAFVPSGGWNEWLRQHQPIGFGAGSMEAHAREPAPKPWRAKEMQQFIATADDCEDPMVQVLDCRSEAEYTGEDKRGNKRGGHIPGARHLDWRLMCDSRHPEYLKSPEERADLIAGIGGFDRDRPVVTVCQSGVRAAFMTIALTDLGYHVANYDASMQEWLNDDEREVETGMPE